MAVLRPHLALTVTDVERSIPFYEALFGTEPEKRRPGYAKFAEGDSCGCGDGSSTECCSQTEACCA
jgi:predicted enzyme related to lactoylglutathione lyase